MQNLSPEIFLSLGFDVLALVLAIAAIGISLRAHKISNRIAEDTRTAEVTAMRLRAKEALEGAKKSFLNAKSACLQNRLLWEHHHGKHMPTLGFSRIDHPYEMKESWKVEREAQTYLNELEKKFADLNNQDVLGLEALISDASSAELGIESLALRLQEPKPLHH